MTAICATNCRLKEKTAAQDKFYRGWSMTDHEAEEASIFFRRDGEQRFHV